MAIYDIVFNHEIESDVSMSILILTDAFQPCPVSASQRVTSFANAIYSAGFRTTVLTANRCLKGKHSSTRDEVFQTYSLNYPRCLLSVSSVVINPFLIALYFLMSVVLAMRSRINAILASVPNGEVAIAGFLASKVLRIPFIVDMRDTYPPPSIEFPFLYVHIPVALNEILISFFRLIYRNSSLVVCVNIAIQNELLRQGVSLSETTVIPNGADLSVYRLSSPDQRGKIRSKYELALDKFIFVYAGALSSYYPVSDAILAAKILSSKRQDFQLLIITHTAYVYHKKLVEKLELNDSVKFLGPLSVAETAQIISACDAGIVTYRGEDYFKSAYGGKIFSYMGCGLPIIASGPPGSVIDNIIQKHPIGFFVGKPSGPNFATGFSWFLKNKSNIKIMGERARHLVEVSFDRNKLGLRLVSLIAELLKMKPRHG